MAPDGVVSSPRRRAQSDQSSLLPSLSKKQFPKGDESNSWWALYERHRFLLIALALLAFLCTIYLYFAMTWGAGVESCSGLTGTQKALCRAELAKTSMGKGKLKFH